MIQDQRAQPRPVGPSCDTGAIEIPEPGFLTGMVSGLALLALLTRRRVK